jgi:membrane-associated phospholipid phosphatase
MYKLSTLTIAISVIFHVNAQNTSDSTLALQSDSSFTNDTDTTAPVAALTKAKPPYAFSDEVYKLRAGSDIPVTAIGTGWSLYAFTQIYSKDRSTEEAILALDKRNIPSFDRHGADVYHPKADDIGDMLFYGSMPLPIILLLDKEIRKDGLKAGLLYLEAMSVTGLLYTSATYFNDRHRPYTYNPKVPMDRRTRGGGKNSFFAGHVALVGTSTFFIAKMLNDYHPDSKVKWLPFTLAGIATATTGLMRYRGGQHFLSDILVGLTVGTLSGILVPHVHKNKNIVDRRVAFTASYLFDTPQFGFTYKLSKK